MSTVERVALYEGVLHVGHVSTNQVALNRSMVWG